MRNYTPNYHAYVKVIEFLIRLLRDEKFARPFRSNVRRDELRFKVSSTALHQMKIKPRCFWFVLSALERGGLVRIIHRGPKTCGHIKYIFEFTRDRDTSLFVLEELRRLLPRALLDSTSLSSSSGSSTTTISG